MKKLENIGFYTLSNHRVKQTNINSPLWRCELILTDACNFNCPYCRGLKNDIRKTLPFEKAKSILKYWISEGLKNVRFSGGEPTLYKNLDKLIKYAKLNNVEHIAISTNGSNDLNFYKYLIKCGVNDFSISLDSCCASVGDKMAGGIYGAWETIISNIKEISKLTYVTVGIVITDENVNEAMNIILFADTLGVDDIRIIPSAQYNKLLHILKNIPNEILQKYPILNYRVLNTKKLIHVRGLQLKDSKHCALVIDDMAVAGNYHFPCIIYMREGGNPIGKISDKTVREDRLSWFKTHNCYLDRICNKNCLDVCRDYNNFFESIHD